VDRRFVPQTVKECHFLVLYPDTALTDVYVFKRKILRLKVRHI
jgi:hypothetical protein